MHAYITDSKERRDLPLYIAAIAIGLSLGISWLSDSFQVTIPSWIDVTSVALLYGLIYGLFDEYAWRWDVFHQMKLVKVPALEGTWQGHVLSSHDNHTVQHEVELHIKQTWTRIQITLQGNLSHSYSFVGAILVNASEGVVLDYEYRNEPIPGAIDAMQIHHGTARLRVSSETEMEGYYYTGRGRGNYGSIRLTRV